VKIRFKFEKQAGNTSGISCFLVSKRKFDSAEVNLLKVIIAGLTHLRYKIKYNQLFKFVF
jgi:hypothetical protein